MIIKHECKCCGRQFEDEEKGKDHELKCFQRKGALEAIVRQMTALIKSAEKLGATLHVDGGSCYYYKLKKVSYNSRSSDDKMWSWQWIDIYTKDDSPTTHPQTNE